MSEPAWQNDPFLKAIANLFTPETRDDLSPEENRVVKLCCKGTGEDAKGDADYAEQLDDLLTAAAARGKPINLNILSQSGQIQAAPQMLDIKPVTSLHMT